MLGRIGSDLQHYMDLLSARQRLVSSNIANVDTPGYRTRDIDFQFEYMSAQEGAQPTAIDVPGMQVRNDGNNVNIDRETRLLAENALRFNVASTLLRSQIRQIRSAIQEGKQ